ncbi:MAG: hypothetical protein TREMPRED_003464 [Tremellales sp. Tagirdzhanova-0007]|nr:MAG: hypothetical protein TREMPRED_003464 [Tremellales sp. Tagirdzhanova-0007]
MERHERSPLREPSPLLTHAAIHSFSSDNGLNLDLTLPTAIIALLNHITKPLDDLYPSPTILHLREHLMRELTKLFVKTWDEQRPHVGSGSRTLICMKHLGLPKVLREAAVSVGVEEKTWRGALAGRIAGVDGEEVDEEWEVWCDPGTVVWRSGGWTWEDVGFEAVRARERFRIIWKASPIAILEASSTTQVATITPARPSYAIPIRAPALIQIPPTPAAVHSTAANSIVLDSSGPAAPLLPSASIVHSRSTSPDLTLRTPSPEPLDLLSEPQSELRLRATSNSPLVLPTLKRPTSRALLRALGSASSSGSFMSEPIPGHFQSLAIALRSSSAQDQIAQALPSRDVSRSHTPTPTASRGRTPSPNTPRDAVSPGTVVSATPAVTPYDGGNVTVLGGGVKLGDSSRSSSVMSISRSPLDRSRSPSVSFASRALNRAVSPRGDSHFTGSGQSLERKARNRRRIIPTYLGHLGQPGIGGPIMGVFGQFNSNGQQGPYGPPSGQPWPHGEFRSAMGMAPAHMVSKAYASRIKY